MSNQRETIIDYVADYLENLSVPPYNTNPTVIRGMEHWQDTINLPAIVIDEGEAESVEQLSFGNNWQATCDLVLIGRMRGSWTEANNLIEDVRIFVSSTANTYRDYMTLMSSRVSQDPGSDRKEIEIHYQIQYQYADGSA